MVAKTLLKLVPSPQMKIFTMSFPDAHIAFCDKYSPESVMDFVEEIYKMYHDPKKPMYVYCNFTTLILTQGGAQEPAQDDMTLVGNFTKSCFLEPADKCNIFTLDESESDLDLGFINGTQTQTQSEPEIISPMSYDLSLGVSLYTMPKTMKKLGNLLQMYHSDMRRCFCPFDIIRL